MIYIRSEDMEATPEIRKRPAKLDNLRPPEEVSVP
jgi:hypothetical protein